MGERGIREESLVLDIVRRVASLTIDRQYRRNALDEPTIREFLRILRELRDQDIACLVVTGAGKEAFSAGADLKALTETRPAAAPVTTTSWLELTDEIEHLPVPVIAAIEGYCLGGGLELALACDLRVVGDGAVLGLPEVSLNALPTGGATFRLPRVVGLGRAREMVEFGRRLTADEALAWGLVSEVVPHGKAFDRAKEIAGDLRNVSLHTLVRAKALVTFSYSVPGPSARYLAYLADALQVSSDEFRSGIEKFASR